MPIANRSFRDKCFKDSSGKTIIGQKPNLPQLIGLIGLVAGLLFHGRLGHIASVVALLAWTVWALLEIISGVNYFRRALGTTVLLGCIAIAVYLL